MTSIGDISQDELALIQASGLFDPEWYVREYPDVALSGVDPLKHFLTYCTLLRRDPGPCFSTLFHLRLHGRRKLAGRNALLHHLANPYDCGEPELVLQVAHEIASAGQIALALRLAQNSLAGPSLADLTLALESLQMVFALSQGDIVAWIAALNRYFAGFNQVSLHLNGSTGDVISRLCPVKPSAPVFGGPLISILMPVFNAGKTLDCAVNSILGQSWQNLEILAIDDASTDDSFARLQTIAARDPRLRPMRNSVNMGPYVAKNIALQQAHGSWITGQDADDWSHPQRLEYHISRGAGRPLSLLWGLRLTPEGLPSHLSRARRETSLDGFARRVPICALFNATFLREKLGAWDSVRFGADTDMLLRAEHVLGGPIREEPVIGLICRDGPDSLSNDALHGTRAYNGRLSKTRRSYLDSLQAWLRDQPLGSDISLPFPHLPRRFPAPEAMQLSKAALEQLSNSAGGITGLLSSTR